MDLSQNLAHSLLSSQLLGTPNYVAGYPSFATAPAPEAVPMVTAEPQAGPSPWRLDVSQGSYGFDYRQFVPKFDPELSLKRKIAEAKASVLQQKRDADDAVMPIIMKDIKANQEREGRIQTQIDDLMSRLQTPFPAKELAQLDDTELLGSVIGGLVTGNWDKTNKATMDQAQKRVDLQNQNAMAQWQATREAIGQQLEVLNKQLQLATQQTSDNKQLAVARQNNIDNINLQRAKLEDIIRTGDEKLALETQKVENLTIADINRQIDAAIKEYGVVSPDLDVKLQQQIANSGLPAWKFRTYPVGQATVAATKVQYNHSEALAKLDQAMKIASMQLTFKNDHEKNLVAHWLAQDKNSADANQIRRSLGLAKIAIDRDRLGAQKAGGYFDKKAQNQLDQRLDKQIGDIKQNRDFWKAKADSLYQKADAEGTFANPADARAFESAKANFLGYKDKLVQARILKLQSMGYEGGARDIGNQAREALAKGVKVADVVARVKKLIPEADDADIRVLLGKPSGWTEIAKSVWNATPWTVDTASETAGIGE